MQRKSQSSGGGDVPHRADQQKQLLFQKVGIFIDAENIELSGLKHHEGRTDYRKILEKVGDREIVRILYYKPEYKDISQEFQNFWSSLGGEIKRPTKNADSFIVIDAVTMAEKLDVVIILGGDKDFLPLIWYMKSRGCRCEIWSWPESTSPEIKAAEKDAYLVLSFCVDPSGHAYEVRVVEERPPGLGLADAGRDALRQTVFSPARKGGLAVAFCGLEQPFEVRFGN